jgi:BTB/POZ domain-containing protein KCTD9
MVSDPVKEGKEPEALKRIRKSFESVYDGPDELYHEYTLQQAAIALNIPLEHYRKFYDLRHDRPFPAYPKSAGWKKAFGAWLKWLRSIPKGNRRLLLWGYARKWGFKILQGSTVLALLGAGIHYLITIPERAKQAREQTKQSHYQAWQTISLARGQKTSAGRIEALQDLAKDHVSLLGLDAEGANLIGVDLHGANLVQSNLKHAILGGANLQDAIMGGSDLEQTYFGIANLQKAALPNTSLQNANFLSANLRGAYLRAAHLEGTAFQNSNLESSNLQETTGLGRDSLKDAHLCHTLLPDDLKDLANRDCDKQWSALPTR